MSTPAGPLHRCKSHRTVPALWHRFQSTGAGRYPLSADMGLRLWPRVIDTYNGMLYDAALLEGWRKIGGR